MGGKISFHISYQHTDFNSLPYVYFLFMMLMLTFVSHHPSSEVDSMSPFLRYLQPSGDEPTLDFLTKSKESRDYLARLEDTDMAEAMILC